MAERREPSETNPGDPQIGAVASRFAIGAVFAGHRIESEIGRGGMGIVYRATHLALDRERALKVIAPMLSADSAFRQRFQQESRLAASVEHPNVIPIHHAGEEDGVLYLSMRFVDGPDLRQVVDGQGPLSLVHAATLIAGVAAGLDAAHASGLIHRDVKPANVLIEPGSEGERVFLTDFGISRLAGGGGTLTSSAGFIGSVDYVAPEQVEGQPTDHRVDIYALGCLLHYALTGKPPFPRDNDLAKLYAHANAERPRPSEIGPGLPPAIDEIVARAMAIRPVDRYAHAGELARELERAAEGEGVADSGRVVASRPSADRAITRRIGERPRRRRFRWVLGIGAVVVAAAIAAVLLSRGGSSNDVPVQGRHSTHQKPVPPARVVATAKVGADPVALTVNGGRVWVAASGAQELDAISVSTRRSAEPPIPTSGSPVAVVSGFGSLWVANDSGNSLLRIDAPQGAVTASIPVGSNPSDVAVDKDWVWVSNRGSNTVSRVDPNTDQVNRTINVGQSPWSIATGAGSVWVANIDGGSISQIDPSLGRVVGKPITVGERPNDLAVGYGLLWVSDVFNGTVTRIDPATSKVVGKPIEVGARPRGIKAGLGYVWVANGGEGTVSRIDPKTAASVGQPIKVGANPADLAIGAGAVWTANFDDSTVTEIKP
jgi:YVTN family beta-propeller protein